MDEKQMLKRIYDELVGDEFTEGIIPRVRKNTKKINTHEMYFKGLFIGGTVISLIIAFWNDIKSLLS